ncbi:MAG: hypothetical protein COV35_05025 [Alphaproteobacteria bacterium CG11_big_fil_rev_8_21_14_0_20_39_49]|nr:MAG: hypothetical protein COV35_05025 [Alphaproteobacteria bacterium CG11_big_fil_rev_8_21_14_0_20_39_49]
MPTISSEPTITPVPTASFAPSMPPTVSSEPSLSPSISAAPTVTPTTGTPTPPTEEGYFIRHGAYSFLATNEPIDYKDTVEQFKSQVDKRNEVFVYKIDDFLLDSDAEKKQALKIAEDTFGNLVWDKKEQTDYATKNSGKWPSQDELLSMGKKIIIQNHHVGKTVPYDTSFFSTYGENEDRSTVADILRGIKTLGLPIPECIDPGPAVDKFSKKDAEKKAEQGGVTSYDDITKGDPRQFDRNLLAPEMWTVLEGVMRFNPETKAGNAAMFGFSSAYAAALGLAGAAMIANQTGGKKEKDTSDKSQKSNNDELSVQSGEVQEPENNKQNILVSTVDKASEFLSTVSKASLPLAAIGQAALKAGALFPDNRVLATGVAAGALGLKVASDVYWNKNKREINPENDGIVREKGVEPTADIVESQRTGRRGKRDKSLSDKVDIAEWTDRTKLAVALGVSAVLNVTGSEKHNTPFPVNVAATIVASSLAVDSLTNWKQRRSPDPSGDKQSLASMKLFSKLASASLIMAQNSSPDKEGAFVSGAIAMGMMAASNLPYYAVSKTVDYAAGKTKSFIDRYRDTKSASNSVGSIDPSNFLRDDGSSKISPESIHSDKSERGKGPIEI